MAQDWYYKLLGEETGPVSFAALRDMAGDGYLACDDEVRTSTSHWTRAEHVPELFQADEVEEPELANGMDLDLLLAPSNSPPIRLSAKRLAQREAVAAAALPVAQWYYILLGQEMGPSTTEELLQQIQDGTLLGEDTVRLDSSDAWKRLDQTPQFATTVARWQPQPEWYCLVLQQELGPMSFDELQQMAQSGALNADDRVRLGLAGTWAKADRTRGLHFAKASVVSVASHDRSSTLVPFGDAAKKREWYTEILGQEMGPISYNELAESVARGTLTLEDKARRGKTGTWTPLVDVPGLVSTEDKAGYLAEKQEASRPKPMAPVPVATPLTPISVMHAPPVASTVEKPLPTITATAASASRPISAPPPPLPSISTSSSTATGNPRGGDGSLASTSRPPAPPAPPSPPSRPAFTPTKKSSGPAFDFGAMFGNMKGSLDAKAIAAIAVLIVLGGYFGMSSLGISLSGQPGQPEYEQIQILWNEVQGIHERGDATGEWVDFQAKHELELQQLVLKIRRQNPSSATPLLQSVLFCARDHLPKMMDESERGQRYTMLEHEMGQAAKLAGK